MTCSRYKAKPAIPQRFLESPMEVSSLAATVSSLAATTTNDNISVAVLKKALDSQSQAAAGLLQAIPAPPNLPAHLGKNVDTVA